MVIDLKGCDVILDEIHTYSDVMQAIVLKLVEVLVHLGCRVHIGTATMPTVLYQKIIQLLGGEKEVYEVRLSPEELDSFDRHVIYKVKSFEETGGGDKRSHCKRSEGFDCMQSGEKGSGIVWKDCRKICRSE